MLDAFVKERLECLLKNLREIRNFYHVLVSTQVSIRFLLGKGLVLFSSGFHFIVFGELPVKVFFDVLILDILNLLFKLLSVITSEKMLNFESKGHWHYEVF